MYSKTNRVTFGALIILGLLMTAALGAASLKENLKKNYEQ